MFVAAVVECSFSTAALNSRNVVAVLCFSHYLPFHRVSYSLWVLFVCVQLNDQNQSSWRPKLRWARQITCLTVPEAAPFRLVLPVEALHVPADIHTTTSSNSHSNTATAARHISNVFIRFIQHCKQLATGLDLLSISVVNGTWRLFISPGLLLLTPPAGLTWTSQHLVGWQLVISSSPQCNNVKVFLCDIALWQPEKDKNGLHFPRPDSVNFR